MAQHNNYWFGTRPTRQSVSSGLIRTVDTLIIGGGIAGITLLGRLIGSGVTNTYLVEDSTVGYHASGRSAGQLMLRGGELFSQMPQKDGIEYLQFMIDNNQRFINGLRNTKSDTDLRESGGLRLATTHEEFELLKQESEFILQHGNIDCPILTTSELKTFFPHNCGFTGGIYVPTEATCNPYKVVNELRELIEDKGARVLTGCCVDDVIRNPDDSFSVSIRHKGTIKAKRIVYCMGAYTSELLPELAEYTESFRGQMIATDTLEDSVLQSLPQMSVTYNHGNEYWRLYAGRLLAGGMRHSIRGAQVGISDDGEFSPAVYDRLRQFIKDTLPVTKRVKFTHVWSGVMSKTLDQLPLIGSLPGRPNEFVFTCFNGYGYSHVMHGSMILKDIVINGESMRPGARLFDPARFNHA
jgi:glycine/D-amino acid oxidase-like deaminating enzyme